MFPIPPSNRLLALNPLPKGQLAYVMCKQLNTHLEVYSNLHNGPKPHNIFVDQHPHHNLDLMLYIYSNFDSKISFTFCNFLVPWWLMGFTMFKCLIVWVFRITSHWCWFGTNGHPSLLIIITIFCECFSRVATSCIFTFFVIAWFYLQISFLCRCFNSTIVQLTILC
jgi:hypothetical protein